MIKAVLFDLDDTLFDHRGCARLALERLRGEYPCFAARGFEDLERDYHRLLEEYHALMLAGAMTQEESRRERFRELLALSGGANDDDAAMAAARFYNEAYLGVYRPVPGAVELLRELKRSVKIGIVTNNLVVEQVRKLRVCGMEKLIDALVVSEDVGAAKPEAAIFEEALRRLGVRAEEAVMIGDAWTGDVMGARGAGIRAVWFNRLGLARPEEAGGIGVDEIRALEPAETVMRLIGL